MCWQALQKPLNWNKFCAKNALCLYKKFSIMDHDLKIDKKNPIIYSFFIGSFAWNKKSWKKVKGVLYILEETIEI